MNQPQENLRQQPPTPKKRCAWQREGVHYFAPDRVGQIFCSHECQRKDDKDRPRL